VLLSPSCLLFLTFANAIMRSTEPFSSINTVQ
jgi:hypothetical protein